MPTGIANPSKSKRAACLIFPNSFPQKSLFKARKHRQKTQLTMQKTPMYRSSRTAVALMAAASTMPVTITVANAGEAAYSYSGLAEREMIRRQDAVAEGDRLLAEGREAYAKGDYPASGGQIHRGPAARP
jgi:hypothetical protein